MIDRGMVVITHYPRLRRESSDEDFSPSSSEEECLARRQLLKRRLWDRAEEPISSPLPQCIPADDFSAVVSPLLSTSGSQPSPPPSGTVQKRKRGERLQKRRNYAAEAEPRRSARSLDASAVYIDSEDATPIRRSPRKHSGSHAKSDQSAEREREKKRKARQAKAAEKAVEAQAIRALEYQEQRFQLEDMYGLTETSFHERKSRTIDAVYAFLQQGYSKLDAYKLAGMFPPGYNWQTVKKWFCQWERDAVIGESQRGAHGKTESLGGAAKDPAHNGRPGKRFQVNSSDVHPRTDRIPL